MQLCRVLLAVALLAAQWAPVAASLSATSEARLFLRRHAGKPPQADELAELKTVNPDAYALVKALLMKRSLGLLNAKDPTASFAKPSAEQQQNQAAAEQGPEVFAKFASPGELTHVHQESLVSEQVAMPYADVQPAAHHDWMNWKPQSSAMNDDQMVANVLGAVAELKGKKAGLLSKHRNAGESSLAADEASFSVEPEPAAAPAKPAAPAAPQENSYLKSIDLGIKAPAAQAPEARADHENSYLKGLDLSGDMPKAVASSKKTSQVQDSSTNALASFSWDDSKPEPPKPKVVKELEADGKGRNLLSWLGVERTAPQAKVAPAAPAKPSNPYLMDLS